MGPLVTSIYSSYGSSNSWYLQLVTHGTSGYSWDLQLLMELPAIQVTHGTTNYSFMVPQIIHPATHGTSSVSLMVPQVTKATSSYSWHLKLLTHGTSGYSWDLQLLELHIQQLTEPPAAHSWYLGLLMRPPVTRVTDPATHGTSSCSVMVPHSWQIQLLMTSTGYSQHLRLKAKVAKRPQASNHNIFAPMNTSWTGSLVDRLVSRLVCSLVRSLGG